MSRTASFVLAACAALSLSACASTEDCEKAKLGVAWAKAVMVDACTQQSKACDAAGLALKIANTSVAALCPAQ